MSTTNNYFTNKSKEELRSLYLEYEDFQRTGVFQNGSKLSDAADFYQKTIHGAWIVPITTDFLETIAHRWYYGDPVKKPDRQTLEKLREEYPKGCRVELIHMDDLNAPPVGTKGTVYRVDAVGSILVDWDNGSDLSIAYMVDEVRKIEE